MQIIEVRLDRRSYPILIGSALADQPAACGRLQTVVAGRATWLVSDSRVAPLYGEAIHQRLRTAGAASSALLQAFPAGEESKTLATVEQLYHRAVAAGVDRRALVVAAGGGVVGDLAGFFAATWLRGLEFIQVPTTLLAMVDSSVGGKVGVDLPEGKNLVGAFHQPRLVWIDLEVLKTLPVREWKCGLSEIVKYGVILDAALFTRLESAADAAPASWGSAWDTIVARCCELKAQVVAEDETETGLRAILNYGHTFGHAVESLGGYSRFNHGEAIAIGMGMAADLAVTMGLCAAELRDRQDALLLCLGLPTRIAAGEFRADAILAAMMHDKKTLSGKLRLVLPRALGRVELITVTEPERVRNSIQTRI